MKAAALFLLALSAICTISFAGSFYGTSLVNSSDSVSAVIITGDYNADEHCVAEGEGSFCTANFSSHGTLYVKSNSSASGLQDAIGSQIMLNLSTAMLQDGEACEFNFQCSSRQCSGGLCAPEEKKPGIPFTPVPLTPSIMQRTYDYQSPIGITLTPVSDISNQVFLASSGFFESASRNPVGYMVIVSCFAAMIVYAIRNQKRIREFFRKEKAGKEDAQKNVSQETFDAGASPNE